MSDVKALAAAVQALAAVEQGRLVVVGPDGVRGDPHDPDRLDSTTTADDVLVVSTGGGHARYEVSSPSLVAADDRHVLLAARRLTTTFVAYGSAGTTTTTRWRDAQLLCTYHPTSRRRPTAPAGPSTPEDEGTGADVNASEKAPVVALRRGSLARGNRGP